MKTRSIRIPILAVAASAITVALAGCSSVVVTTGDATPKHPPAEHHVIHDGQKHSKHDGHWHHKGKPKMHLSDKCKKHLKDMKGKGASREEVKFYLKSKCITPKPINQFEGVFAPARYDESNSFHRGLSKADTWINDHMAGKSQIQNDLSKGNSHDSN